MLEQGGSKVPFVEEELVLLQEMIVELAGQDVYDGDTVLVAISNSDMCASLVN
jgi:hypothetical protein